MAQSTIESWWNLQTKEGYEEWKERHLDEFLADNSEYEKELTLDDEDKSLLLRMCISRRGYLDYASTDLTLYMKKKYGIKVKYVSELYNSALEDEICNFWKEILRMEKDPEYVSQFEHIYKMWHLRQHVPFSLVDIEKNILRGIIWYHDQSEVYKTPQWALAFSKESHHCAKKELLQYNEYLMLDENFRDSNNEDLLKEKVKATEPKYEEDKEKLKKFIETATNNLQHFKELMANYGEHQDLLAVVEEAEEKLAAAVQQVEGPVSDAAEFRDLFSWGWKREAEEKEAYKELEDKLTKLEPPGPVYLLSQMEQRTRTMPYEYENFQSALQYFKQKKMADTQREKLNELYGSSTSGPPRRPRFDKQQKKALKFGDKYMGLRKVQLETIDKLKHEYKDFTEKKALFEAIVEAETVLSVLEEPMKEFLANRKELNEFFDSDESDSDVSMIQHEEAANDNQIEEPEKAIANHSSWFTSWF